MSPTSLLSYGALLMAAILTFYLVQALRQAQKTALAMEELLNNTRPNVEAMSEQLKTLVTRANAVLDRMEEGSTGVGSLVGVAAQAAAGWRAGGGRRQSRLAQALTMLSAIAVSVERTCSIIAGRKASPAKERRDDR